MLIVYLILTILFVSIFSASTSAMVFSTFQIVELKPKWYYIIHATVPISGLMAVIFISGFCAKLAALN